MNIKILHTLFICSLLFVSLCAVAQGGILPVNSSVNGTVTSANSDVWNITTTADGLLRLTFKATAPADLVIALYDNNGSSIIGTQGESFNNSVVTLLADGLSPGTYHVKVSRFSLTSGGSYTLSDSLFTSALANDLEPNGNIANATVLPLNNSKTGHTGYYYNNIRDTTDWYKVTTTSNGLLRLYLTTARGSVYSNNSLDVTMTLYDNNGTTQLNSVEVFNANNPATASITTDGLAPGTYYVKVQPYSTSEFANYTITDSLFTTALGNDQEPNGNAASAITLALNNKLTGNVGYYYNNRRDTADWYKVTTNSDGLLRVYLTTARGSVYSNNALDVNVTLYDNNGTTQLGGVEVFSSNNPSTGTITTDGLAPGTYFIKVQPYSTGEFANYTLTDSLFTALANDQEPNSNRAGAGVLPLNSNKTGHTGYYYNNVRDTADWYKVTTTSNGLLRVYLATARGSVYSNNTLDVNVTLYDNNGTTQLGSAEVFNSSGPATGVITTDGLAPGTYYLKVQPYSTSEFANYTITDSLFTTALANDQEANGTAANAIALPLNNKLTGNVGYYYNSVRDTADWYKITTTANGLLRLYLTTARGSAYSNNTLDVNISLYDNNGTTQLGSVEAFNSNGPATGIITTDGLAPGTYYVKVQPYSTSQFANYTLTDSLFTTALANDQESNGSSASAITLPLNNKLTGNVGYYYNSVRDTADWYKVTTTTDGLLRIYIATARGSVYSNNTLDVDVFLYDNNGTAMLGNVEAFNSNNPATGVITKDGLAAGTYYIKVQPYSTSQFANYTITDSLFSAAIANDAEPNGSAATALDFRLGSRTTGHAGYYYNNKRDTADWYKIVVPGTIPLHLYLHAQTTSVYSTTLTDPIDMLMTVYGSDGTTQLATREIFSGNKPATDSLFFPALGAGTYYVKVNNYSTSEFAYYTLMNALTASGASLPVTFLTFNGVLQGNQALLSWSTAIEINNKGFEIQRSSDGQAFHAIGFANGHGNTAMPETYSFADEKIAAGSNYYRLKQIDLDGHFTFSSIIRLDFIKFDWSIAGNPIAANSAVQLQLTKTARVTIQVITMDGRIIKTISMGKLNEGAYSIPLAMANAAAGMYIVQLITDNQVFSKKIIK